MSAPDCNKPVRAVKGFNLADNFTDALELDTQKCYTRLLSLTDWGKASSHSLLSYLVGCKWYIG